jgi:hypothetical protein
MVLVAAVVGGVLLAVTAAPLPIPAVQVAKLLHLMVTQQHVPVLARHMAQFLKRRKYAG